MLMEWCADVNTEEFGDPFDESQEGQGNGKA